MQANLVPRGPIEIKEERNEESPTHLTYTMQANLAPRGPIGIKDREENWGFKFFFIANKYKYVRSLEDGFGGCWNTGTVIQLEKLKRHIRYDNILEEDGSYCVEAVSVPAFIDGKRVAGYSYDELRGIIMRPIPPMIPMGEEVELPFGLCVDVDYEDAWWEGVIFDRHNGMEERSVFFPDLGDEIRVRVQTLRLTQDWNEVSDSWKQRGMWTFLEVLEEIEKESFISVSIKQIYYDVRQKADYSEIKEWTCKNKDLWRGPVKEVNHSYNLLTCSAILDAFVLPPPRRVLEEKTPPEHEPDTHTDEKETPMQEEEHAPSSSIQSQQQFLLDGPQEIIQEEDQQQDVLSLVVAPSSPPLVQPELCPEAVVRYYLHALNNNLDGKRKWRVKAMQHLLAEGWGVEFPTNNKRNTLYKSPQNNIRLKRLQDACKVYVKESIPQWIVAGMGTLNNDVSAKKPAILNNENSEEGVGVDRDGDGDGDGMSLLECVKQLLRKEETAELNIINELPTIKPIDENTRHENMMNMSNDNSPKGQENMMNMSNDNSPKGQEDTAKVGESIGETVQEVLPPSSSHCSHNIKPQNVMSWLINKRVVQTRSKVYYRANGGSSSRDITTNEVIEGGRITRDGIKCRCCKEIHGLNGFIAHVRGNNNSDTGPYSGGKILFLKDGRSLLDCQKQVMTLESKEREAIENPWEEENDYTCSVCQTGGDLILCDHCPSSFHAKCVGLKRIPGGDWFCPLCLCTVCRKSITERPEDEHFLTCFQCELKYHVGCLGNRTIDQPGRLQGQWFCGKECEEVYDGLQKLLGKPISLKWKDTNLTWTLMKYANSEDNDSLVECYSKLSIAALVMHECFEPLKSPISNRELTDDVIFGASSTLPRANYQSFYTVLLERNEELISVANIRVYGEKVAEIPFVATRFQCRRRGMCSILMKELEKVLGNLGVKRLVLPAVPDMLETWTKSFGFVEMSDSERAQYLDHVLLQFPQTKMCHKVLRRSPLMIQN
ncbi:hypothetical protein RIF29_41842 [Crotalaria pallida]|uniref:Uncharacterized protein n=1 Tax=Crotalaria pallida TaxID=3830 RepID=A0AAN9E681_CROPI